MFQAHAGLHPSEKAQHAAVPIRNQLRARSEGAGRTGHVDIVFIGILRNRRQHPDHGVNAIVHLECLAHDVRIAALVQFPIFVAQKENRGRSRLIVGRSKIPPQNGLHSEHPEKAVRNHAGRYTTGFVFRKQRELHGVVFHQAAQRAVLLAVIRHFGNRVADASQADLIRALMQHQELIALLVRQRLQQNSVDHTHDRGVGPDA